METVLLASMASTCSFNRHLLDHFGRETNDGQQLWASKFLKDRHHLVHKSLASNSGIELETLETESKNAAPGTSGKQTSQISEEQHLDLIEGGNKIGSIAEEYWTSELVSSLAAKWFMVRMSLRGKLKRYSRTIGSFKRALLYNNNNLGNTDANTQNNLKCYLRASQSSDAIAASDIHHQPHTCTIRRVPTLPALSETMQTTTSQSSNNSLLNNSTDIFHDESSSSSSVTSSTSSPSSQQEQQRKPVRRLGALNEWNADWQRQAMADRLERRLAKISSLRSNEAPRLVASGDDLDMQRDIIFQLTINFHLAGE
ncbi:hypothetical protein GZH46_00384 [Fragariocoptes setiger]|uniref:Uncharacterized protein n=1 Tax=Fragariocoptes setiger TaxID=1670756 RepID=A0ABQ7SCC4_9ACAR|nr:hypothetical protein GZH46_00384 [Fragariocoptes setiger]